MSALSPLDQRVNNAANAIAARRGIKIMANGSWRYFSEAPRFSDLTSTDIDNFLRRYYSPSELSKLHALFSQERKKIKEMDSWASRVSDTENIRLWGAIPAKLHEALLHDYPDDFGGPGGIERTLTHIENLYPGFMYQKRQVRRVG